MQDNFQVILCTHPHKTEAAKLAHYLVANNLAACVNIINQLQSIYPWEGKVTTTEEQLLIIKSHCARYKALETAICAQHPYAIPEIIVLPIKDGLPHYLSWLNESLKIS